MKRMLLVLLTVMLVVFGAGNVMAAVSGAPCVDCHTMHNSQDGEVMRWDQVAGTSSNGAAAAPALLRADECTGCHASATITNNGSNVIPQVDATTYGTDTLAGGSFNWVTTDETTGHNVDELNAVDTNLLETPPGWDETHTPAIAGGAATWTEQLRCSGTYGCHGDHTVDDKFGAVQGAHHEANVTLDGSNVGRSYRFLLGILGAEDADWEFTNSAVDHNVYAGVARNDGDAAAATTISYLCAECHGKFHSNADINSAPSATMTNPWLRHPTDIDMVTLGAGVEYAGYVFNTEAPVAVSPANVGTPDYAAEAIVTCLSCHRPHGSPNADLLRWDYAGMIAGTALAPAGTGCFQCHTTKDGI